MGLGLCSAAALAQQDDAIILLSTHTIHEMQQTRRLIEKKGGSIRTIFPPSVFIGKVPRTLASELRSFSEIQEISYDPLNPARYQRGEHSTLDGIDFWNSMLEARQAPRDKTKEQGREEPFRDDALIAPDLPKTEQERRQKDQEYQEHWRRRKEQWLQEEHEKLKGRKRESLEQEAKRNITAEFGTAAGAGFLDTSLYLAGNIAVGVFFGAGTGGSWTSPEIDSMFNSIGIALNRFATEDEPNAGITLTLVKEVDESGSPKPIYPDGSAQRTYVNDLRNLNQTDWAYIINVYKGNGRASAYLFGPRLNLYSTDLRGGETVRHETMHVFGATDQYCPDACKSPISRWGYLRVVNANAQTNDGYGFFGGRGEGVLDLMTGPQTNPPTNPIGVYSRGQVGWRDSDGDGILDEMDTFPESVISGNTGMNPFTYTGQASDKPLRNAYGPPYGDVTVNTIRDVEYRINNGAWVSATPQDGSFDSGIEDFTFTTPSLKIGNYVIEVKATNSVGNTELSFATSQLVVTESSVENVGPFGAFTVSPPTGSLQTTFSVDASMSRDFEDSPALLQVRWDIEDDGVWETAFSQTKTYSFSYPTAGLKTIRLEVKDTGGLTNAVTRQMNVAAANQPPKALFTMTPENQHRDTNLFSVNLDASASLDGEDAPSDLQLRWDFENDGVWDTPYSNQRLFTHNYELPRSQSLLPPLDLTATALDTPGTARDVQFVGTYAYVADGTSGLEIIDISNPATPTLVGSVDTPGEAVAVTVSGIYAYLASTFAGLQIIDITDPAAPALVGSQDTPGSAQDVSVSGNFAYVADYSGSLQIIDISTPTSPSFVGSYSSLDYVWGVEIAGNYAYVASGNEGLEIINVTNPVTPFRVGKVATGFAWHLQVAGNYAYVANTSNALKIVDITNPAAPKLAATYVTSAGARDVHVSGDFAYLAVESSGVVMLDVHTPAFPKLIGSYNTPGFAWGVSGSGGRIYVADGNAGFQIVTATSRLTLTGSYPTSPFFAYSVYVSGQYAYVADQEYLRIIDVSDPTSPTQVGRYDFPGDGTDVQVVGNYAYVATSYTFLILDISNPASPTLVGRYDGLPDSPYKIYVSGNFAYFGDGGSGLQIVDITDPSSPTFAGSYNVFQSAWGVHVSGYYAYVAFGDLGLRIIDISNPASPILVGECDTPGYAYGVSLSGNYAYVADGASGLQVIDVGNPAAPAIVATYDTPGNAVAIDVSDNYAYVTDEGYGLRVFNITKPVAPTYAGALDTPGIYKDVHVQGNYAYVADQSLGLQIINIADVAGRTSQLSKHWKAKLEVKDTAGEVAHATRDFWVVPYNHPPLLAPLKWSTAPITAFGLEGSAPTNEASGIFFSGIGSKNYAFVAEGYYGLEIFDVTNPGTPFLQWNYTVTDFSSAEAVYASGNFAYVAFGSYGLRILEIDPFFGPFLRGTYSVPGEALDVFVSGNFAYIAAGSSGLQIVDISDPSNPTPSRGSSDTPGNAVSVYVSGSYAYVADSSLGSAHSSLRIFDISVPLNPIPKGNYTLPDTAAEVFVSGAFAYVANWSSGLQIIDIGDVQSPTFAGNFDTSGYAVGVFVSGDRAYITDASDGIVPPTLQVIDISTSPPAFVASYPTQGNVSDVFASGNFAYIVETSLPTSSGQVVPPSLEVVSSRQSDVLVVKSVATDLDSGTTWDGLVEYRWDLNNDQIWDTPFSSVNYLPVLDAASASSVVCEVKDRFHATHRRIVAVPSSGSGSRGRPKR